MKTKQEQIAERLLKPFEIGDDVIIQFSMDKTISEKVKVGRKNELLEKTITESFTYNGKIIDMLSSSILVVLVKTSTRVPHTLPEGIESTYSGYDKVFTIDKKYVTQSTKNCGSNPFRSDPPRIDFYNQDISSMIYKAGYEQDRENGDFIYIADETYKGINFNPFIIDENGKMIFYQRDFCWSLKDKQLLIDSIYNGIEIGKIVLRYKSWDRITFEKEKLGESYNFDCVDGKQRLNTIIEFVTNKFPDSYGNYWSDLSSVAQRKFLGYGNLSYGQLGGDMDDKGVIDCFLRLNFTGVQMSQEHLDYVKTIKI